MKRWVIILGLCMTATWASGQELKAMVDSTDIQIKEEQIDSIRIDTPMLELPHYVTPVPTLPHNFMDVPNSNNLLQVNPNFYDKSKVMAQPDLGGFWVSGSRSQMPGLMGVEEGKVGYLLQTGRFSFAPFASAAKYGYFGGLTTSYGYGGTLNFIINEHFTITAFGQYDTYNFGYGGRPINPAVLNGVGSTRYGGFVTWEISDKVGIDAGLQRVYDPMTGRWQNVPIVSPYLKVGGQKMGFDVGGLLYQIFHNASASFNGSSGGPTGPMIGAPRAVPRR